MTLYWLEEFIFLCKLAGFRTIGEVQKYMRENNLDWKHLYYELDALCFPDFQ